jgi:hypothetical protein
MANTYTQVYLQLVFSPYEAFSYSRLQIDSVIKYIDNKENHHRWNTFEGECQKLLEKFNLMYDERYLFEL